MQNGNRGQSPFGKKPSALEIIERVQKNKERARKEEVDLEKSEEIRGFILSIRDADQPKVADSGFKAIFG